MAHGKTTGNPNDFILPDLGEGVHEAELIKWRGGGGQRGQEHDILAGVETDKGLVEVASPRAGGSALLQGKGGETLKVGNPLVTYEGRGGGGGGGGATEGKPVVPKASHAPHPSQSNGSAKSGGASLPESSDDFVRTEDDGTVVGSLS